MGRKEEHTGQPKGSEPKSTFDEVEDSFFATGDASAFWERSEEEGEPKGEAGNQEAAGQDEDHGAQEAPAEDAAPAQETVAEIDEPVEEVQAELSSDEDSVEVGPEPEPDEPQASEDAPSSSPEESEEVAEYNPYSIHPDPAALSDQETEVLNIAEARKMGVFDEETVELSEAEVQAALGEEAESISEAKTEPGIVTPDVPPAPAVPEIRAPAYAPSEEGAAAWREAATTLEREASVAEAPEVKAKLLSNAARILLTRVGDWSESGRLFDAAITAGLTLGETPRAYTDVVANRGDFECLRDLLIARAEAGKGLAAAEHLQDAALVERKNLRRDGEAVALLERCLAIKNDWFTLRLMRELHYRADNWSGLIDVLDRMAGLVSGVHAARIRVEQGRLLEAKLEDKEAAASAYTAALEADPSYMEAFLAAGRLAGGRGDWGALVDLYAAEAKRLSGADVAFWLGRAARVARDAGLEADRVADLYAAAVEAAAADQTLRHEQQAFLMTAGRHSELAASYRAEADAVDGTERALAMYRLGRLQETNDDNADAAIESYRAAVVADSAAAPASEAVCRLLTEAGDHKGLVDFLSGRLETVAEPSVRVSISLRIGEIAERALDDLEMAADHYERCLEMSPGYVPALDALERVCAGTQSWQRLVEVCKTRAGRSGDPDEMAHRLYRAGTVCETHLDDPSRAAELFQQALQHAPDHHGALEAATRALATADRWGDVAQTLRAAAANTRSADSAVQHLYRAARILDDRCEDTDGAIGCLQRCLDLQPNFLPAVDLLRELSARKGNWQSVYDLRRLQAGAVGHGRERQWHLLDAAEVTGHLEGLDPEAVALEILDSAPGHLGALTMLETAALRAGDKARLLKVYGRFGRAVSAEDAVRIASRIADVAQDVHDDGATLRALGSILDKAGEVDAPLSALARVAVNLGRWMDAERALLASKDDQAAIERARLLEAHSEDRDAVAAAWRKILENHPSHAEAASGLERAMSHSGVREGLADVHAQLATSLKSKSVQAMHSLLAGHLYESDEDRDKAVEYYHKAFKLRPIQGKAMDALVRIHAEAGDVDAIAALFKTLKKSVPLDLAQAMELAEAHERAANVYEDMLKSLGEDAAVEERLSLILGLEHNLARVGDWPRVCECLAKRAELCKSEAELDTIEAKRRWILAEKLSDTEEAWDFYRKLHELYPEDADVLEALARIAGARGESGLAIQFLDGLSNIAATPDDASRYQRRIAEVHLAASDSDSAREAFLRALDHKPEDIDALDGLKNIAREGEDWASLVGVLSREVKVLVGEASVACHREIATIWEEQIGDLLVATDAWRKVLELVPGDSDALGQLVHLSRQREDWAAFIDYGQALVHHQEGEVRSNLLAEIGRTAYEHLQREDDAVRFLNEASLANPPSVEAAQILEAIHGRRGAWEQVVEALMRQARAVGGPASAALYLKAARTRRDMLHDRRGAASIYDQVLRVAPSDVEALRFKGDFLFEYNDLDQAVDAYSKLDAIDQERDLDDFDVQMETALFYYRFGEALRRLGRETDALEKYKGALALNQSHLPSLEAVGPLFIAAEEWGEAARTFKQILQLTGGHGDANKLSRVYTNLGVVEYNQGDEAKALKRFNKALEMQPNDVRALQGYGRILFDKQDWNSLLTVYNNIIYHAQEPSDVVDAYLTKGFVLDAKLSLSDKAAQHYEKSLAFDPAQPVALLRLAELSLRREAWPDALSLADRARSLPMENVSPQARTDLEMVRAVALDAMGQLDEAMQAIAQARELDPDGVEMLDRAVAEAEGRVLRLHDLVRERLQAQL